MAAKRPDYLNDHTIIYLFQLRCLKIMVVLCNHLFKSDVTKRRNIQREKKNRRVARILCGKDYTVIVKIFIKAFEFPHSLRLDVRNFNDFFYSYIDILQLKGEGANKTNIKTKINKRGEIFESRVVISFLCFSIYRPDA